VYALLADGTKVEIGEAGPDDFGAVRAMDEAMNSPAADPGRAPSRQQTARSTGYHETMRTRDAGGPDRA
jgi:hypothetical protein